MVDRDPQECTAADPSPLALAAIDSASASDSSPSPMSDSPEAKKRKLSKRQQKLELKLKLLKERSLFDTDGDLSTHNIIEQSSSPALSTRNSRKRRMGTPDSDPATRSPEQPRKAAFSRTAVPTGGIKRHKARPVGTDAERKQEALETLTPTPTTPLERLRNDVIKEKIQELQSTLGRHEGHVREMYHLINQSLLEYKPNARVSDESLLKFAQNYNLWDLVEEQHFEIARSARRPSQHRDESIAELLQLAMLPEPSQLLSSSNIPSHAQRVFVPVATTFIPSGTGLRRFNRQYETLHDYLSSFVWLEDNEDASPEDVKVVVDKEASIRKRLDALNKCGGFSTQLQAAANRRPQLEYVRTGTHHDKLLSDMSSCAKLFHSNSKYRKTAARKCAKAIDRYWETVRTTDERRQKEEQRRMTRLAKWTAQQVRKKWKVVERVCEARYKELLKEEQAKKGRRHLELILEHSEQVLGVRMEELASRRTASETTSVAGDDDESMSLATNHSTRASSILSDHGEESEGVDDAMDRNAWEAEDERDHIIDNDGESDDNDELKELEEDQGLSVEQLIQKYNYRLDDEPAQDHESTTMEPSDVEESVGEDDAKMSLPLEDDEYTAMTDEEDVAIEQDGESEDDETELNALAQEADLSVEELMKRYNYRIDNEESDADDEEDINEGENIASGGEMDEKVESETMPQRHAKTNQRGDEDEDDAEILDVEEDDDRTITDYGSSPPEDDDDEEDGGVPKTQPDTKVTAKPDQPTETALTPIRSSQPTESMLSTAKVDTRIPFLLRGTLREYQHVGLDWLASLYANGLNGILADEMGLGKTIQTISLLAYLACEKGIWGPHLIVVPTSVILNWEMEFKRWLPGFKILTYYGNPKERKEKRFGWSKENAFHVCITSYQLVLQDQNVFRRKAWQYLVLDEAHHIKNFRSQRWQVLLNFNSNRRLLLTGTPLQNNLMELWSLLYFLMPNGVSQNMPIGFANLKEFQEWFSHPVDRMLEGQQGMDDESRAAIQKLHTVLRPYLLRRLKADVEKQLPEKHEHIVYCRLSKRQRYLYDDFMGRGKTRETLASGSFLSIINCLMQLRKVCNHPDLFEERPILTSFSMEDTVLDVGESLEQRIRKMLEERDPMKRRTSLSFFNVPLLVNETRMSAVLSSEYELLDAASLFLKEIAKHQTRITTAESRGITSHDYHDLKKYAKYRELQTHVQAAQRWQSMQYVNTIRCAARPIYGAGLISICRTVAASMHSSFFPSEHEHDARGYLGRCDNVRKAVLSYEQRIEANMDIIELYGIVTPKAVIYRPTEPVPPTAPEPIRRQLRRMFDYDIFHPIRSRLTIAFPDKRLLQYDCGKLQKLATLLRDLAAGGHRALIFTQMTRVLDVLEAFLNMHGHRYLRLDGATKVEQRQVLTEQFNNNKRILCFILSTRSGGLGINLTGADTVIFYDSDWNPSMDKQCQDRTHRIGQTRDVHIYRFVTEYTIEENIFKKANQKRMLDNVVIQEGEFTNDYFNKMDWWRDLPEVTGSHAPDPGVSNQMDIEQALLEAEDDETDAAAAIAARNEMAMDEEEFDESAATTTTHPRQTSVIPETSQSATPTPSPRPISTPPSALDQTADEEDDVGLSVQGDEEEDEDEGETDGMQLSVGHVDQYMLRFWEREMFRKYLGFGGLPPPVTTDEPSIVNT